MQYFDCICNSTFQPRTFTPDSISNISTDIIAVTISKIRDGPVKEEGFRGREPPLTPTEPETAVCFPCPPPPPTQ